MDLRAKNAILMDIGCAVATLLVATDPPVFNISQRCSNKSSTRLKRCSKYLLAAFLFAAMAVGVFVLQLAARHNFHVVSAGRIYRSGRMGPDSLARAIHEHGIKSIFNLCGENDSNEWYRAETATVRELGVKHFDFNLSASRELDDREMEQILATMDSAPKPILIHCKSGSDRTGLVGALYLYGLEGEPASAASRELSMAYGHVPHLFWRSTIAMDNSFWRYVKNHEHQPNPAGVREPDLNARKTSMVGGTLSSQKDHADFTRTPQK